LRGIGCNSDDVNGTVCVTLSIRVDEDPFVARAELYIAAQVPLERLRERGVSVATVKGDRALRDPEAPDDDPD
jgi:hypothetical protein